MLACLAHIVETAGTSGFSYDGEIGCVGIEIMLTEPGKQAIKPHLYLIGEPAELKLAVGNKGKPVMRC